MSSAASPSMLADGLISRRGLRGPETLVPFDEATPEQKQRMATRARKRKGSDQTEDEKRAMTWLRHKRRTRARKAAAKASRAPPKHGDGDVGSEGGGGDDRLAEQLAQQLPVAMPVAPLLRAAPKVVPGGAKGPQSFLRAAGHGGPRLVSPPSVSPVPGSLGALRVFIVLCRSWGVRSEPRRSCDRRARPPAGPRRRPERTQNSFGGCAEEGFREAEPSAKPS